MMQRALVIGYGNELRRDDGIGPRVARDVAALGMAGLEVIEAHQLLPEHAEVLSRFRLVVFVDASLEAGGVEVRRLEPSRDAVLAPHASDPEALLALAEALYGHAPEAWLVSVSAVDIGIGEGVSDETEERLPEAVETVVRLIEGCAEGENDDV